MKASHCRRRARCVGILSWHDSRLRGGWVSVCVQLHVVIGEAHSQRPTPRNPCDGSPCRIPLESASACRPITGVRRAFLSKLNPWPMEWMLLFLVLLVVCTRSKNHGRTVAWLVVNGRKGETDGWPSDGQASAWSKGLQTLASGDGHTTCSL
ncbi:hypothetical protein AUEXF2481DRAFT_133442 [Aureobasidium subglaciale EXF-2481]|uniref:Uncharacterized protein n=1 Tax=Aureobasidium subglaciale (strain EXF-2481) TaxID=1043005 RepID=A0A074ZQ11_AURSE|nr:uncharacterized protein AUEXF2481DRAFT_133442 [Aureobasidium subglaciale EXF-2481]KER00397.1 hypothetical protein AUEXF2481DRAFT_133442 [Aureobasidium subglaciale EXF-2481]